MADRQDRVAGFKTQMLQGTKVLLIGAGGMGSQLAYGLVRKGIGHLAIADNDVVEISNLNRQQFYRSDLYQPKALRLARNAAKEGFLGSTVAGHLVAFQAETAAGLAADVSLALCCVDNNRTRAVASQFFRQHGLPVIFAAVNENADHGWVFVQEVEGPCVGCVFPRVADASAQRKECTAVGAVLDILKVVAGLTLYAVDSLLMQRRRDWNFRSVSLIGDAGDVVDRVSARAGCRLCGNGGS